MVDLVGRFAGPRLPGRVVPAGREPLGRGTGDVGLGVVPHHQHPRRARLPHQIQRVLEDGRRRLGHLHLVGDNEGLKPAVPAQFVQAPALGHAEAVGDDPHPDPPLQGLQGLFHPLQRDAQGDDLLQEGVVHRHGGHRHLLRKQGETGLLQVGSVDFARVVLLPQPLVQGMVLRHPGRCRHHAVDLQGPLQGLGDREIEQGFVQIEQHPVIACLFHACPY